MFSHMATEAPVSTSMGIETLSTSTCIFIGVSDPSVFAQLSWSALGGPAQSRLNHYWAPHPHLSQIVFLRPPWEGGLIHYFGPAYFG